MRDSPRSPAVSGNWNLASGIEDSGFARWAFDAFWTTLQDTREGRSQQHGTSNQQWTGDPADQFRSLGLREAGTDHDDRRGGAHGAAEVSAQGRDRPESDRV